MDDDLNDPIDHDFFDDDDGSRGSSPERSSRDKQQKRGMSREGKQNGAQKGMEWTSLALSARSTSSTGSRKEIQAKIPTGTPRAGDYIYSSDDDFDEESNGKRATDIINKRDHSPDSHKIKDPARKEPSFSLKDRRNLKSAGPRRDKSPKTDSPRRNKETSKRKKAEKSRTHNDSYSSESDYSDSYSDSYSSYSSSYTSASDSESEITDVSPLPSPHQSPRRQRRQKKSVMDTLQSGLSPSNTGESPKHVTIEAKPPTRPQSAKRTPRHKDMVHFTGMTPNGNRDRLLHSADSRELSLLLKAVLELDESAKQTLRAGVSSDSTKKVLFKKGQQSQNRKNQSFSNDRVREIDGENQRLLGEILRVNQSKAVAKKKSMVHREPKLLSHAALNRARQQRKIERENFELLKRIQGAKPTTYLKRDSLLKDHERQLTYGLQVSNPATSTPERPMSGKKQRSTVHAYTQSMGSRSSSMSSLQSGIRSRPGSGRPMSGKIPPERPRPVWDDRFYIAQE
ncbi:uncharacterized protein LOC100376366 [Saccoglossus kowalevskii]|uniref:UPF0501 protein KIAA1430 homolog n=1 Tax=Saccoglossus kowalevskii TaxID=10224 RepID=A0ABM0GQE6_SACKO|nr:PREDICTED: UPF0501 protein KIAA1430 homolog [Saccoglossus kowalevskii]